MKWPTPTTTETLLLQAAEKYGLQLGSPSAAPCGASCVVANPFEWWDQFFGNCTGCQVDFLTAHYYSCNADGLKM